MFSTASFSDKKNDIKGGRFIIKISQMAKKYNVVVVVVALSMDLKRNYDNIICAGAIKDKGELAEYYSLADVVLLTSKRETYSMVTAEALMCGTPVSGFYAGGPETIAISEYSRFCDYGDSNQLFNNALELMSLKSNKCEISMMAHQEYNKKRMCQQYFDIYKELTEKGENL